MQGVPPIPLGMMLGISLGVLGLGVLSLLPIWWRGRARRAGHIFGIERIDVDQRNIAGSLLTLGTMGLIGTELIEAGRVLSAGTLIACCVIALILMGAVALIVDARSRHH